MKSRTRLLSDIGIIGVGMALTLIVLVESTFPPWVPYFIFYALLTLMVRFTF